MVSVGPGISHGPMASHCLQRKHAMKQTRSSMGRWDAAGSSSTAPTAYFAVVAHSEHVKSSFVGNERRSAAGEVLG